VIETGGHTMASAEREAIAVFWGKPPSVGSIGRAPGQRVTTLKLKHFFAFRRLTKTANLPTFPKFGNTETTGIYVVITPYASNLYAAEPCIGLWGPPEAEAF